MHVVAFLEKKIEKSWNKESLRTPENSLNTKI
jgi:hypothetical protein